MSKLTTERLERKIKNCIEIEDVQVMLPLSAAEELLAFREAAKNPAAKIKWDGAGFSVNNVSGEFYYGKTDVYLAPVLPKQPVIPDEITSASAPEVFEIAAEAERLGIRGTYGSYAVGWNACRSEMLKAQPVSEPYKLKDAVADIRNSGVEIDADKIKAERDAINSPAIPDGWKLVPIEPTAAMFHAFNDCDYGRKSMRERYIQMIEAAPAHTLSEHSAAIKDVIAERERQVSEEGWTPAHDDQYADCELTQAAICYIDTSFAETNWPWAAEWWKPTNPRRDLVKAGALILAEIERMDRIAPAQESE